MSSEQSIPFKAGKIPIIHVRHLFKTYESERTKIHALRDVSLEIFPKEIVFIIGPTGSGKTSLINLIAGITTPSGGSITVSGHTIANFSPKELNEFRKQKFAFLFQFYSLIPTLTTLENVELMLELHKFKKKVIKNRAINYLKLVGLEKRLANFPSQLSSEERQRVAIARAFAKDPEILLFDEPTEQLDQTTSKKIVELITRIAKDQEKTILMVTQDKDLNEYAERFLDLESGVIVKKTDKSNLKANLDWRL